VANPNLGHGVTEVKTLVAPLVLQQASWYALVVEDQQGCKAYSDPIWIDPVGGIAP
jgi:hypothetical protein